MKFVFELILILTFFIAFNGKVDGNKELENEEHTIISCEQLEKHFDKENVFEILNVAYFAKCIEISDLAKNYIISNFQDFLSGDKYLKINVETFNEILSDDKLNISSENQVFEALMAWIKHDINERQIYLFNLFKSLRITFIDKIYFIDKIWNEKLIENCEKCSHLIDSYKKYLITNDTKDLSQDLCLRKRDFQTNSNKDDHQKVDHIYVFTIRKESIKVYDLLNNMTRGVSFYSPNIKEFNTAAINNQLYIIGGSNNNNSLKSVYKLNPLNGNWSQTISMNFERSFFGVAVNGNKIFVSGGLPMENKFECFDSINEKWEIMAEMLSPRREHCSIYHRNHIYVFGGFYNEYLKTVEKYDIIKHKWSKSKSMLSNRNHFGVALLNDKIYAVGGYNGSKDLNTGEVYDYENDSWSEIAAMNEPRFHFALIAYNNKLFAIGGYKSKTIEIYDPSKNQWQFMDMRKDIEIDEVVATHIKINS